MDAKHETRDANDDGGEDGHGQDTGAPAQQQSGESASNDGGSRDMAARRMNIGRAKALRAGEESQLERQHRRECRDDRRRPSRRAASPALRQQRDGDREHQRQDDSLIGEIGDEGHEPQVTRIMVSVP
jgi:hypothetical protein